VADDRLLWEKVDSQLGPELPLFRVRFDLMRHPRSGETFRRLVLESEDWVNVVAVATGGRTILVDAVRVAFAKAGVRIS
jgi:hypothetical protein